MSCQGLKPRPQTCKANVQPKATAVVCKLHVTIQIVHHFCLPNPNGDNCSLKRLIDDSTNMQNWHTGQCGQVNIKEINHYQPLIHYVAKTVFSLFCHFPLELLMLMSKTDREGQRRKLYYISFSTVIFLIFLNKMLTTFFI